MITLYIDGSAKRNWIGAGLVIDHPERTSPLIHSFYHILNIPSTSTVAEFFALRKALEWIQTTKPKEPIHIVTDSMEVATKTPQRNLPPYLLSFYPLLCSQYSITLQQAERKHEKMILLAHHASRKYLQQMESVSPLDSRNTYSAYPPSSPPFLSSLTWLCLKKEKSQWKVNEKGRDLSAIHTDPIIALHTAVQRCIRENPTTHFYFDLTATQIIRYHSVHFPSDITDFLLSLLERKVKRPINLGRIEFI